MPPTPKGSLKKRTAQRADHSDYAATSSFRPFRDTTPSTGRYTRIQHRSLQPGPLCLTAGARKIWGGVYAGLIKIRFKPGGLQPHRRATNQRTRAPGAS